MYKYLYIINLSYTFSAFPPSGQSSLLFFFVNLLFLIVLLRVCVCIRLCCNLI